MLVSTWSFALRGHAIAWPGLAAGGAGLDAVEQSCTVIEADEEIDSVGYGGLPDRDGAVTLDGCIMQSPSQCGSACCLRHHLHPVRVARAVMEQTGHIMLAGEAADEFADSIGEPRADLVSPKSRLAWEAWKKDGTTVEQVRDVPRPVDQAGSGQLFSSPGEAEARWGNHDTIGTLAMDANGRLAGACSTSGAPWKVPGRIGDSPIIGHGLYVDPGVGAVTATGSGELVMGTCGSFLAVESMRRGARPIDALVEVLQRIADAWELEPGHQVCLAAIAADGQYCSAALRPGFKASITSADRNEAVDPDVVLLPGT